MKLTGAAARGYFNAPETERTGLLIYGADAMRVALARQRMIAALLGPGAEEEMRLTRLAGGDLRKEPSALLDAVKAVGFFPGARAVHVEDATDAAAPAVLATLEDWRPGDAQIVVTAGQLKPTSKLRKAFETHKNAYAVGLYDEPPGREELSRMLKEAGLDNLSNDAFSALTDLSRELGPGDFTQTLEKIALYKLDDPAALSVDDIADCTPRSTEADLDDVLHAAAEGRADTIGPLLRRLQAQGANPVTLCIGATRHFRTLYAAASAEGGPAAGIGKLRPPVFGPRRDRLLRQAQAWGPHKLETALTALTDTDLQLRSGGQTAPNMALMERALVRLAMLAKSR